MSMRTTTDYCIIHCSATRPHMDIGVKEIDRWHRKRGFSEIGYHWVIRKSGLIEPGRDFDDIGAHAVGWNHNSVSVCLVGGLCREGLPSADYYTEEQWESLDAAVAFLEAMYPGIEVMGHRDIPDVNKACPCFDVSVWMANKLEVNAV